MGDRQYTFEDVFLAILANLPEGKRVFNYGSDGFKKFFYNNRNGYSVLDFLAFGDKGIDISSKEVDEAERGLRHGGILCSDDFFEKNYIKSICSIRYNNFTKERFNKEELKEIKDLSGKFVEEFF